MTIRTLVFKCLFVFYLFYTLDNEKKSSIYLCGRDATFIKFQETDIEQGIVV